MSAFAYLVYRPVMEYEESMEPYFICATREAADAAEKKMCDYASKLAARMPLYTHEHEAEDKDCSKFTEVDAKRRDILRKARWPFGVNLTDDIKGFYECNFDPSCVRVMELPLKQPTP